MTQRVAGDSKALQSDITWGLIAIFAVLIASYWNSLSYLPGIWANPEFSHGYLIPLFAFFLLWNRREPGRTLKWGGIDLTAGGLQGQLRLTRLFLPLFGVLSALLYGIASLLPLSTRVDDAVCMLATILAITAGLLLVRPTVPQPMTADRWWGVGLLVLAGAVRLWGAWHFFAMLDHYSFILALAGAFLLLGGRKGLHWAWPAVAILFLMFPLPLGARAALVDRLQVVAIDASTYCLQTVGLPAFSEGNRIVIGDMKLGVVEACSGLRMLTVFAALTIMFAIAILSDRPLWERWFVALSALPIALFVNVVRITVTGVLYHFAQSDIHVFGLTVTKEFADRLFHDWAGYFMMPLALGLLFLELQILPRIFLPKEVSTSLPPTGLGPARPARQPVSAGS